MHLSNIFLHVSKLWTRNILISEYLRNTSKNNCYNGGSKILPKLGSHVFVRSLQVCFIMKSAFILRLVSSICLNDNNTKVRWMCHLHACLLKYFGTVLLMKGTFNSKCLKQSVTSLHIKFNLLFDFEIELRPNYLSSKEKHLSV